MVIHFLGLRRFYFDEQKLVDFVTSATVLQYDQILRLRLSSSFLSDYHILRTRGSLANNQAPPYLPRCRTRMYRDRVGGTAPSRESITVYFMTPDDLPIANTLQPCTIERHFMSVSFFIFNCYLSCRRFAGAIEGGDVAVVRSNDLAMPSSSRNSSSSKRPLSPSFDISVPLNVTIQYGGHAYLVCRVQDVGNKSVRRRRRRRRR